MFFTFIQLNFDNEHCQSASLSGSVFENVSMFLQVNVAGTSFMVQAAVEQMQGQSLKENCSVVNLSSISAHQTQPNRQVEQKKTSTNFPRWTYAASKGAINILTKNMALDLAKYRIRVNSVSPGWIWSPEVAKVSFLTIYYRLDHSDHSLVS